MSKDAKVEVRLPAELKRKFNKACQPYGLAPAAMIRELIAATVEKRITLAPSAQHRKLYPND